VKERVPVGESKEGDVGVHVGSQPQGSQPFVQLECPNPRRSTVVRGHRVAGAQWWWSGGTG
jgi:hypothetical protein